MAIEKLKTPKNPLESLKDGNLIIIGNGQVGSELKTQLEAKIPESTTIQTINSRGIQLEDGQFDENWKEHIDLKKCKCVFMATPSRDPEINLAYMLYFLNNGIPVITCEKAALANYCEELKEYIDNGSLRFTASVGGGTKMLLELKKYLHPETKTPIETLEAIVNGTLNFVCDSLDTGVTEEKLIKEIEEKKIAEPNPDGETTLLSIIKGEINDVILKATILANYSGLFDEIITPEDIKFEGINSDNKNFDINSLKNKRCMVKIVKEGDKFLVKVGFMECDLVNKPKGVENILVINGDTVVIGQGAGPVPTAKAMIDDI